MRIATWNLERFRHKGGLTSILDHCRQHDILVLTETDQRIEPGYRYCCQTLPLDQLSPECYLGSEHRVSIYTDYDVIRHHTTYDPYTAACVELQTERGPLIVYGTIMGVFGNRHTSYQMDLKQQLEDIRRLSGVGDLCVIGDYNCSFSDTYYYTKTGRGLLRQTFQETGLTVVTKAQPECVDHIAISESFLQGKEPTIKEWNMDKVLSDHKGIEVLF